MSNAIICALSAFNSGLDELPSPSRYLYKGKEYAGAQTNIAPVECLLDNDENRGTPAVVYLCSEKCKEPLPGYESGTEGYFREQIERFCASKGAKAPQFVPISYDFENPDESLPMVTEALEDIRTNGDSVTIHVDLTGAGRDATTLLALASQTLAQQPSFKLGSVVYANWQRENQLAGKPNKILEENKTFDLVELMQAVRAFTRYAHADDLCHYFEERPHSRETGKLCDNMRAFSDDLSLCQVSNISKQVGKIRANLNALSKAVSDYIQDVPAMKREHAPEKEEPRPANATKYELYQWNLRRIQREMALDGAGSPYGMSEILLASLAPSIEADFIAKGNTDGETIFGAIRWCASHRMLQQALSIFREHMGQCLIDLGYVRPTNALANLPEKDRIDRISNLPNAFDVKAAGEGKASFSEKYEDEECFSIDDEKSGVLAEIVPWLSYIKMKRNLVMHSDDKSRKSINNKRNNKQACKIVMEHYGEAVNPSSLKPSVLAEEIASALRVIEGDNPRWGKPEFVPIVQKPVPAQEPAPAFKEARAALLEYARFRKGQDQSACFKLNEDYNNWASHNSKNALTKKTLGLRGKKTINRELANRFPDTFTAQNEGRVEITPEVWNTL